MAGFKVFRPDKLKLDAIRLEVLNELRSVGREVKRDYDGTVSNWKPENKPTFEMSIGLSGGPTLIVVATGNTEIYEYVTLGTDAHIILPRNSPRLAFRTGYTAKTSPGSLQSGPGGYSGNIVYSQGVIHPGTEPRDFEGQIEEKYRKIFADRMEQAVERGAKRSGHEMP